MEIAMPRQVVTLEDVARRMAADAGVAWHDVSDHPGYSKGGRRDCARRLIKRSTPSAIVIDGIVQWNGRMSDDLVANISDDDVMRLIETGRDENRKLIL